MCYSAMVKAEYGAYRRLFRRSTLSISDFYDRYWRRKSDTKVKIPKFIDAFFADPQTDEERQVKGLIDEYAVEQSLKLQQEVFKQRARLADAERTLLTKTTKAATEARRISTDKVSALMSRLDDLKRTEPKERDSRIFPGTYAPVVVMENGEMVIKPMRYQCRPAGKLAFYDVKYPGTYNADMA